MSSDSDDASGRRAERNSPYDVVLLGETMLRFTPEGLLRLEQAEQMQVHVGGSESNTAVGLARLGKKVAWISRLTDNHLGRRIERTIAAHGVDTQHVVWTKADRVGLYFLESGTPPRTSQVIYDRANSAYAKFQSVDLPPQVFERGRAKWLHITGISLWLGQTTREMIANAIQRARAAGWQISFDVNHRTLLCSASDAYAYCHELVESADLVFLPRRDANHLWGWGKDETDEQIIAKLGKLRNGKTTVMTLGTSGAIAIDGEDCVYQPIEPVEPIGRLGGGDAFSAGFLAAWLEQRDLRRSLLWATSTARLKYSILGDLPLISRVEVETLVNGTSTESLVR